MGLLQGRVAVVTGGASAIGRAIAVRFAQEGCRAVVIADILEAPREGGRPTQELVAAAGAASIFLPTDVTDLDALRTAIDAANEFGGVDILVSNAGLMRAAPLLETTEAEYDELMAVNAKAAYFGAQAAARSMIEGGRAGVIINLSSTGGLQGAPGISAYCAAKGAVRLMSYAMATELGRHGVRVVALHPGVIDTQMTRVDVAAVSDDDGTGRYRIPMGRFGHPDDVAGAAALVASDAAGFVTGASLTIDGGQLCAG